jgi:hypothetical protein
MLTGRADPGVDRSIVDGRRDWVESFLLSALIWVVQVKFVNELVECHGEVRGILPRDLGDFSESLRAL